MFRFLSTLLSVGLLCSCAINTNVGEYVLGDVETSVRGHNVEVFTDRQLVSHRATFLGQVSSYYCQLESDMHLPQAGPFDDIDGSRGKLQETLKSKVQQRGATRLSMGSVISVLMQIPIAKKRLVVKGLCTKLNIENFYYCNLVS